jgi:hypothetical protein
MTAFAKQLALAKKYPALFKHEGNGIAYYTCIAVGDGWLPLVEDLCEKIVAVCTESNLKIPTVFQVKEKFGGLRFYVDSATDKVFNLIDDAEELSFVTCEDCGEPGHPRGGGWIKTLCDTCDKDGTDEKEEEEG